MPTTWPCGALVIQVLPAGSSTDHRPASTMRPPLSRIRQWYGMPTAGFEMLITTTGLPSIELTDAVPTTSPSDVRSSDVSPASGGLLDSESPHTETATAPPTRASTTAAAATRSRPRQARCRGGAVGEPLMAPMRSEEHTSELQSLRHLV